MEAATLRELDWPVAEVVTTVSVCAIAQTE
jgi:hypothetical protein